MKNSKKHVHVTYKEQQSQPKRLILLSVLGYEAAGCLLGGIFLVAAPDGSWMNMPVDMLNGTFSDFLIPGIILFGLGLLNTIAFIAVFRRKNSGWILCDLALGGLIIWFLVEIVILQQLHWLHVMWGVPVIIGGIAALPLMKRQK